jgi:hypothetical protein
MINIETVRKYLKAHRLDETNALNDCLVIPKELGPKLWAALEDMEDNRPGVKFGAVVVVASIIRDLMLSAYGSDADEWHYNQEADEAPRREKVNIDWDTGIKKTGEI